MKWGQLKQQAERAGVADEDEIIIIDEYDDRYGVASVEGGEGELILSSGDPEED